MRTRAAVAAAAMTIALLTGTTAAGVQTNNNEGAVDAPQTKVWDGTAPATPISFDRTSVQTAPAAPVRVHVGTTGHQAAIDRCAGPVASIYRTGTVIGEHNHCGGAYVLDLRDGQVVEVTGVLTGRYQVAGDKRVAQNGTSIDVLDFAHLYLQTCYFDGSTMRVVGLVPVP